MTYRKPGAGRRHGPNSGVIFQEAKVTMGWAPVNKGNFGIPGWTGGEFLGEVTAQSQTVRWEGVWNTETLQSCVTAEGQATVWACGYICLWGPRRDNSQTSWLSCREGPFPA